MWKWISCVGFLSTPSARRATIPSTSSSDELDISIHALREEGDSLENLSKQGLQAFLSTPSARRATRPISASKFSHFISIHALREEGDGKLCIRGAIRQQISIHALREEGDPSAPIVICMGQNFYPRPPRGGRHKLLFQVCYGHLFLSTPSARRATRSCRAYQLPTHQFLSTPSARRATLQRMPHQLLQQISIHALREEGDW